MVRTGSPFLLAVACPRAQRPAAAELFELFKIPWAFADAADAAEPSGIAVTLVSASMTGMVPPAPVMICCGPEESSLDAVLQVTRRPLPSGTFVTCRGERFPVYTPMAAFETDRADVALKTDDGLTAGFVARLATTTVVRLGYDLFAEVDHLLRTGQPTVHAMSPTLDSQIGALRSVLLAQGVPVVEIPPAPAGHPFIACLSHDIDFIGIRHHRFDRSFFGFVLRAIRSLVPARGRNGRKARKNLTALLSLPAVHLRLARDFWNPMDRYVPAESGLPSTYYFVPFADRPGRSVPAGRGSMRAVRYDVDDYADNLRDLERGCSEVGVHGIDAWCDVESGANERAVVNGITGRDDLGIRMHWLYFSEGSPRLLEEAGYTYDSTLGFNDAIGYRNGTAQVFRPHGATELLELPLHIQDTAMLFPARMHLSERAALTACESLVTNAVRTGGVLTINWHDRSLAPERNWDALYADLLGLLRAANPWFARGRDAVAWFRQRRAIRFKNVDIHPDKVVVTFEGDWPKRQGRDAAALPPMLVRVHRPTQPSVDAPLRGPEMLTLDLRA
jgi:hypothetical protein